MRVIHEVDELAEALQGTRPVLVPTMGALHAGHLALIRRAHQLSADHEPVVVSIFVNPTQFGRGEDFSRYPRMLDADVQSSESAGAQIAFAPSVESMYPSTTSAAVPKLPAVATQPGLEDAHRPTHFAGVCQVVARLFDLINPKAAIFGEKDYQQLLVVSKMVVQEGDRWPDLQIVAHPTVRERDGLAMSSRNAYLKPEDRRRALGLSQALQAAESAPDPAAAETAMRDILESHQLNIDYAAARDAATLMPIQTYDRPARGLIAARVGAVRLIDNAPLP